MRQRIISKVGKLCVFYMIILLAMLVLVSGSAFSETATAQTTQGPYCWNNKPVTPIGGEFSMLHAIAPIAQDDAWAVGFFTPLDTPRDNPVSQPLIEHWNGITWTQITASNGGAAISADNAELNGVAAVSSNDVWVVGKRGTTASQTFIMHFDGQDWTLVPSPSPGHGFNVLNAIVAIAYDDIWAVGAYGDLDPNIGANSNLALILHWNGYNWTQISARNTFGLEAVAALTSNDVWAVGGNTITHWDGAQWALQSYAEIATNISQFHAIAARSSDDVWFVGEEGRVMASLHWDGHKFNRIEVRVGRGLIDKLYGVTIVNPNDVWAVGEFRAGYVPGGGDPMAADGPLVVHWDGEEWKLVNIPEAGVGGLLWAIANRNEQIWTVGYSFPRHNIGTINEMNSLTIMGVPAPCQRRPLTPPISLPDSTGPGRLFPETGKEVKGVFLKYWEQHGGLAQFGYPISDEIGEVSDLNGQEYTMQYFERAVFEYHAEFNTTPDSEVLLSQLGTFQYYDRYSGGAPQHEPSFAVDSVYFPQTGKRLAGKFLDYWNSHGGLSQQGYPISDEFMETNSLDGKDYRVQYFERAVFEMHPENIAPYDVLLTQLGTARYRTLYDDTLQTLTK